MADDSERRDRFLGAWRVSEYVHTPEGAFVGIVHQHRLLTRNDDGTTRVTQRCRPDDDLRGHPMEEFAGEWTFDLRAEGETRHYLGPAVIGRGTEWTPGSMTGEGVWPDFGYAFTSYAGLVAPDRQVTGGMFSVAGSAMCAIVGVAETEDRLGGDAWPELDLGWAPDRLLERSHGPLTIGGRHITGTDGLRGTALRVGPTLLVEGWLDDHRQVSRRVLADATTDSVISIELVTTHRTDGSSYTRLVP